MKRPQFSLRILLVLMLLFGAVVGVLLPVAIAKYRTWTAPPDKFIGPSETGFPPTIYEHQRLSPEQARRAPAHCRLTRLHRLFVQVRQGPDIVRQRVPLPKFSWNLTRPRRGRTLT